MQAAKAGGLYAVGVTWGGIHDRAALADADVIVETARSCLPSSEPARARKLRELSTGCTSTTCSTSPSVDDATYDRAYDELVALEESIPSS